MKEKKNTILCGRCGSGMKSLSHKIKDNIVIFECMECYSSVAVAVGKNEHICPYCFSGKYFISGIEDCSSMCASPECPGYSFKYQDSLYYTLTILWNKETCFQYHAKNRLESWTDPVPEKLQDFYEKIIKHHKLPKYFLGYRGITNITYWFWKKRFICHPL